MCAVSRAGGDVSDAVIGLPKVRLRCLAANHPSCMPRPSSARQLTHFDCTQEPQSSNFAQIMFLPSATVVSSVAQAVAILPTSAVSHLGKVKVCVCDGIGSGALAKGGLAVLRHSSLFIWRCLGRPRPLVAQVDPSNSCGSQQHFLFLPKVDRVTLTLSPLEAT